MPQMLPKAEQFQKNSRYRRIWHRIFSVLACIVVFCTTYALILPAITQETAVSCGFVEHTHDDSCYTKQEEARTLICTLPERPAHIHTDDCWAIPEQTGHVHGTDCIQMQQGDMTCTLSETEAHHHDSDCYNIGTVLVCTETDETHVHEDSCYEQVLVCQLSETDGHAHSDSCYAWNEVLICTEPEPILVCTESEEAAHVHDESCYAEENSLTCSLSEDETHSHSDRCYGTWLLTCKTEEHSHELACYSDPSADVETAANWERTFADVELTGIWSEDVLAIAESQLGYHESTANYVVAKEDDGKEIKRGYTRYGAWYGDHYGDWCAMFVSFCLNYAEVDRDLFPIDSNCENWIRTLSQENYGLYHPAVSYLPKPGDLIFFDWDQDGISDHVGLVSERSPATESAAAEVRTIEGNSNGAVRYNSYDLTDRTIMGYGQLPAQDFGIFTDEEDISLPEDAADLMATADLIVRTADDSLTRAAFSRTTWMQSASAGSNSRAGNPNSRALEITGTTDMTDLINAVTVFKKQNGAWVEVGNGTVTEGEDLKFTIDYTVGGMLLSDTVNTLVYKIPSSLTQVVNNTGSVYNKDKEDVGTFVIDAATNTITITFSDTYVENNKTNKAIEGSISFYATVENITQGGGENTDIVFSDKVQIELGVVEKEDVVGDVKVKKSIAKVEGTTITYQVVVTSETGTSSKVTLTDEMTGGLKYKNASITVKNKNGQTVNVSPTVTDAGFTLTLNRMNAGDIYTITYTAELNGPVSGHQLVNNKAIASSTNNQNIKIDDFAEVDHTFKILDKTSEVQEDGTLQWTIVINEAKANISGAVLSDKLTDENGVTTEFKGPVTITDSSGRSSQITLPYTFPQNSTDTYTITYSTTHDYILGGNGISNWAGLNFEDTDVEFEDIAGAGIGTANPIVKDGEILSIDNNNGRVLNQWTITVDTGNASLPAGSYIQDLLADQYMTKQQILDMYDSAEEALAKHGLHILKIYVRDYVDALYDYPEVLAAPDDTKFGSFLVYIQEAVPKGTRFSFTYTATADGPPAVGYFYNHVRINELAWYNADLRYDSDEPFITKFGIDPNNFDHLLYDGTELDYENLTEENGKKTLWWRLQLQLTEGYNQQLLIKDTLPEGLELAYTIIRPWRSGADHDQRILYPDENGKAQCNWWDLHYVDLQTSETADGKELITYTFQESATSYLNGAVVDIYVVCTFRDDFTWGGTGDALVQLPFVNSVSLESPTGKQYDVTDHTYKVNYDNTKSIVSKLGTMTPLNELKYQVVLNRNALDLDPDESTLKILDVLTYVSPDEWPIHLYLKPGSVYVYDYTNGVKGELIDSIRYVYTEDTAGTGDITYTHTLDLTVPDSRAMLLEYTYTVDGTYREGYSYDMFNTCTVTGIADSGIQDDVVIEVKVYDANAEANYSGVYIYKVDAYNNKLYLPGAVFHVYTWNQHTKEYVQVKHPKTDGSKEEHYAFTTDENGYLSLNDDTMDVIAYNTAYYIVEINAPSGYFKDPDPYYFYIYNSKTNENPYNFPPNFNGDKLESGALIYYYNEPATTELTIHKKWEDYNGNPITVTGEQVTFELWQKLDGVEGSDKLYDTYTFTPDQNGFWEMTITGLPKGIVNPEDGTKGTLYRYYLKEVSVPHYKATYVYDDGDAATTDDSDGINSGRITMTNRELEGYDLPETGGAGTLPYTMAGLMLMLCSTAYLLYRFRKRGKEVT